MSAKRFTRTLVTTALPYANGPLHLGHCAGTFIPADIFVRYKRLCGEDIIHIGGSDEHGAAITIAAEKAGTTPQALVDKFHALQKEALQKLGISFDNFSRTSLPIHHQTTQEFFLDMARKGIFVKKVEKQFYDEDAKMFLADRYIVGTCPVCRHPEANGDQCENCGTYLTPTELINPKSKLTGKTPILRETLHWYFPLGRYQKALEAFIDEKERSGEWRQNVINYARAWLKEGLGDRAITRDVSWGVKVPLEEKDAEGKVIYVWYDAVLGYISSTKEWAEKIGEPDKWKEYWLRDDTRLVHFIGKDNVVFHALMFPAMLMAKNEGSTEKYVLVDNVVASEFMNIEGKKFSKSRGYAVYLHEFLEKFPADALRYTIAMNYPETHDTDFSWKDFQNRTNGELADTLGNFVKRAVDFCNTRFGGTVPAECTLSDWEALGSDFIEAFRKIDEAYEGFHIRDAAFYTMEIARRANRYLAETEPWKTYKTNPEASAKSIAVSLNLCFTLAVLFEPILPHTSQKILRMLGIDGKICWNDAKKPALKAGHKLSGESEILFRKIDDREIEPELKKIDDLIKAAEAADAEKLAQQVAPTDGFAPIKPPITIEEFEKIDLRIGTVVAAERVPKADKLLRLSVKIGSKTCTILSGIAEHYKPEEMLGKNIIVVANLAPRKIRGIESQGMLLAVEDADGKLCVVTVAGDSLSGRPVK
ncbi:MAG: methionine--tRNA ligase [Chloroherpetonaceae bacterium]|nr:methionine--tRNA ligase [Chloroherpetonaceae bacterium]MCS7210305.1 methionine--tRNA ligase [Chloroherpetonaceae bacterium]MDW8020075.1 methionine--tRNA ligase [Chloroherpetonaceae bacterium]